MTKFGVYIHWPFCKSKCPYCDFFSQVRNDVDQDSIVDSYLEDIAFYAQKTGHREVTSIFFGGGTPSLLSPQNIERIISAIDNNWTLSTNAEISLEANPNTQTPSLFTDLHHAGINRLSLGVQSLNDEELKFLGRTHNSTQALNALEDIVKTFDNHSADLIYALPQQSDKIWQQTLQQILTFNLKHLSLYQLTIEEGTFFAKKGIRAMDDEASTEMYISTTELLEKNGYLHYEVSNYAQPNFECHHNLLYWQGQDYVGIGQGAHGRLHINNHFFATTHPRNLEELSSQERAEELLLMGLRLCNGINKNDFKQICGLHFDDFINKTHIKELEEAELIANTPKNLRITPAGFLVMNKIIEELI